MYFSHGWIDQLHFIYGNENAPLRLALEVGVVLISAVVVASVCVQLYTEVLAVFSYQTSCVPHGTPL